MEVATRQSFNLVIDEFQEFYNINKSIYSDIQDIWDQYRQKTHMNFVVSGSIYSLMEKIFHNEKEPLFGRADNIIKLSAFSLNVLKKIIKDYHPQYTNDDLSVSKQAKLLFMSQILFCRLLKQTAKERTGVDRTVKA